MCLKEGVKEVVIWPWCEHWPLAELNRDFFISFRWRRLRLVMLRNTRSQAVTGIANRTASQQTIYSN